jgi:hypothetical protein
MLQVLIHVCTRRILLIILSLLVSCEHMRPKITCVGCSRPWSSYGVWMIDYVCIHLQSHVEIYHDCDKRPQNRGQSKREDEKRCIGVGAKRRKSLAIRAESNWKEGTRSPIVRGDTIVIDKKAVENRLCCLLTQQLVAINAFLWKKICYHFSCLIFLATDRALC